jgi:hypothetical protein
MLSRYMLKTQENLEIGKILVFEKNKLIFKAKF